MKTLRIVKKSCFVKKIFAIFFFIFAAQCARATIIASTTTGTTYSSNGNVNSFTLNRPSSVNVGDLLLVQITVSANISVSSVPSGWTQLADNSSGNFSTTLEQFVYYHVATSSDTANGATSWSLSNNARVAAAMIGFRSDIIGHVAAIDSSNPDTGNSATLTATSMTASAAGRLVRLYGQRSTSALNSNAALTRHAAANADSLVTLLAASRAIAGAGTTGSDVVTASTSARYVIHSVLLIDTTTKPATCYSDDFSDSTAFGKNWATTSVGSHTFVPTITGGHLQLTDNNGYESTGATLQRLFPTSNLIYVEFNHYAYPNSSGADGIAVTLSDASITPQPGGFGGSLGYAQRNDSGGINGFAGGWMGVALDEYGNFSNATEGRIGGPGRTLDSVSIRGSGSGQTGYVYVAGTTSLNPGIDSNTTPGPGYRYRIIIDAVTPGQTYVTVDRDTTGAGTNYTNLIPTFNIEASAGQAAIPANLMLTLTGSTGGSQNVHEIGNLSVCATTINNTNLVDHFEFTYASQALTCDAAAITIKACANTDCSTLMSVPVTVTLNTSGNFVGGNTQTFTGSTTLQLRQNTPATATFSVASSSPGAKAFSTNICNNVSGNTCSLSFVDAGLEFDVPNVLANKPSGAVRLRAVKNSGDATNSCVALFQNMTQNINFWSTYSNPSTGTRAVELRPGSGSGTFTSISGASPGTALPLVFDANGETTFEARYNDAGLMTLNAKFSGGTTGTYANLTLTGTDNFVSTPAGFCVRTPDPTDSTKSLTCTQNSSNNFDYAKCSIFTSAGNPFPLIISAVGWESDSDTDFCTTNAVTPNYSQNNLSLSSTVVAPVAADPKNNINGVVTPLTFNMDTTSKGIVTLPSVTESEVGVFEFVAAPPQHQYQGVTMPSGSNLPIGRFIPHHFTVANGNLINRKTSCVPQPTPAPAFTYMDERFDLSFNISAQNANNQVTKNYQGDFETLHSFNNLLLKAISPIAPPSSLSRASFDANSNNSRLKLFDATNNPMSATWTSGVGSFTLPLTFARVSSIDGPYATVGLGIAPIDSDGVTATGFDLDTSVPADSIFDHVQIGSSTEFRYGRLRLDSVSGPASLPLSIPITAEYWNGGAFVTNTDDTNCTTIAVNNASVTLGPYSGNLNSGETNIVNNSGSIVSGKAPTLLQLGAPGNGNEGSVGVSLDVSSWPWLQFDWNGDGALDPTATATASFGTYRGSDRVIFWQETQ